MANLIKNGTVITENGEEKLDILMENGKIAAMSPQISGEGHSVYDAAGCIVFPGFIDAHTHLDMDNGVTVTADNFDSGTAAALCGGTTTLLDFATQNKGETLHEALTNWHKKADGNCNCNYGFHMAITDWNENVAAEIPELCEMGVTSFKLYMAYDALRLSDAAIYEVLCAVGKNHGIVGVHCENGDLVNELIKKELSLGHNGISAHPISRPDYVEAEAITRYCAIAKAANTPIHIVHLSTEQGMLAARNARKNGQKIYIEGCPQYFTLDDSLYLLPGFEGAKYVCSPPLRGKSDVKALWLALTNGEINSISTDHCSFNFATQKSLGKDNFSKIPNGMPGIEHRGAVMLSAALERGIPYSQMAKLLSGNAARLFGLYASKGSIAIGKDADITVWNPDEDFTITAAEMHQNVDYTPYEGMHLRGRIKGVFLSGELCSDSGNLLKPKQGYFTSREVSEYF
ncbi:MAG: dihydropyrimidinase [Oscillospiraceae bacterium]